jgi:hypothetical protein
VKAVVVEELYILTVKNVPVSGSKKKSAVLLNPAPSPIYRLQLFQWFPPSMLIYITTGMVE